MKKAEISTKDALINLYMTLKSTGKSKKSSKKEEELEYLSSLTEIKLIKYIKDIIDCTILTKVEKKINDYSKKNTIDNIQTDYESMLIKYESDIRGHIKTEHQLKLYADSLQNNIEDLEKEKNENLYNKNYKDIIKEKNEIISELKNEINYNKKLAKSYEDQNIKLAENEKKLKKMIVKMEKKYKTEIDELNKKLKNYADKLKNLYLEKEEKIKKNETTYCYSSRSPNNPNIMSNYLENDHSMNSHNVTRIYRNANNSISINHNHSTSMVHTRPYEKYEKYLLNKYPKDNSRDQTQRPNKIKNLKNGRMDQIKEKNRNSSNNISKNSFMIEQKVQEELMNKYMINDSSLNSTMQKSKKIYHRHKSIENINSKCTKIKQMNIIKKILMSNNSSNTNNNSMNNSNRTMSKPLCSNNSIMVKKMNNSIINKDINISNIIGNKNNIGCNFVNNINIYSNNLKQNHNSSSYIPSNLKKNVGIASVKELISNNLNSTNYMKMKGNNKNNNFIYYRNKQKDGKIISSLTNTLQKNF